MQKKSSHGVTKVELLVTVGIFLLVFLALDDVVKNAKYTTRTKACHKNLTRVGQVLLLYRTAYGGKMPPSLVPLLGGPKDKWIPLCPLSGSGYVYRYLAKPVAGDIVCWDSHPHKPEHSVFTFLNQTNRNILTADGNVRTVSERQFQAFHLEGAKIVVQP